MSKVSVEQIGSGSRPTELLYQRAAEVTAVVKTNGQVVELADALNVSSLVDAGEGRIIINRAHLATSAEYGIQATLQGPAAATVQVDPDNDPTTDHFGVVVTMTDVQPRPPKQITVAFKRLYLTTFGWPAT